MAPCDIFLFPKMKRPMKGRRFATTDEVKTESLKMLKAIPKRLVQKCFKDWHKCSIFEGDYFQENNIDVDE